MLRVFAWGLLIATGMCWAETPQPVMQPTYDDIVQHYGGDEGLPQNGVNDIVQTRDGYLWVATFGGLARFDGQSFNQFPAPQGHQASAPERAASGPMSDRIQRLFEDDRGRLWIGTQNGGVSLYHHGVFQHVPFCRQRCQVNGIIQGRDGALWATSQVGVLRIDADTLQVEVIDPGFSIRYSQVVEGGDGRIYVAGIDGMAVIANGGVEPIALPASNTDEPVIAMRARADGRLLIGTSRHLREFDPRSQQWQSVLHDGPIAHMVEGPDGRLWVATGDGALLRQDAAGELRRVPNVPSMTMVSLHFDNEGNLWIGSHNKGLLRVREPLIGLLSHPAWRMNVPGRAIVDDGAGGLWFTLACGGLRHWHADGTVDSLTTEVGGATNCAVTAYRDRSNRLWVGDARGVLLRVSADGRGIEPMSTWPATAPVNAIREMEDGRIWVSTGLETYALSLDDDGAIRHTDTIAALGGMSINQMLPAQRGGTWFVGDQGARRLINERVVERWSTEEGLSSRFARSLHEDADDVLWIGSYGGGLDRIENGVLRNYNESNGLLDNTVSCILSDESGRLWLAGNRGISLLVGRNATGDGVETLSFTTGDGLVPSEINGGMQSACHRDLQGRLWFALVEGFAVLDPALITATRAHSLHTHIHHVAIAGQKQALDAPIQLGVDARNLEIGYSAINLSAPGRVRFRFRLSGVDDDWIEAGSNRSIVYPSIPWGEHTFEVQARNAGGTWSSESAQLSIQRPAPWYQRPWVWLLTAVLGVLMLLDGTRVDQDMLRRHQARLARLRRNNPGVRE